MQKRKIRISIVLSVIAAIASILVGCNIIGKTYNQNSDNTIYQIGDSTNYLGIFRDKDQQIINSLPIKLVVTGGYYPGKKQTRIEWIYNQLGQDDGENITEWTGVIDSDEKFFIHPPRLGVFEILSFADFPTISTKSFKDSTSSYSFSGEITMLKEYNGTQVTKVITEQSYKGKTTISFSDNSLGGRVHHTHATAKSAVGLIAGDYYFSETKGFVRLKYTLPDSSSISIEIIE